MLDDILRDVLSKTPKKTLYHYTNYAALLGITRDSSFHLTEINHLNDAHEVKDFRLALIYEIIRRKHEAKSHRQDRNMNDSNDPTSVDLLNLDLFEMWLQTGFGKRELAIFVGSFTEEGNLLSQWRGYCDYGAGISLGFRPDLLLNCIKHKRFYLGECVYRDDEKATIANRVIDEVLKAARQSSEPDPELGLFPSLEPALLTLASIIKHSDFREEREWRVISPAQPLISVKELQFRTGRNALIPFIAIPLPITEDGKILLQSIYVGPTPDEDLAVRSLQHFARQSLRCSNIFRTMSPYRR